eukprot:TRINITY_DN6288_c0_g1_i2.p1 TRINITY_DN6288_c0_g1~~TRINITY_DN6288_c0_g1_i2.p1  ORF type:complete len:801 (+),score=88.32 TRINITY_DN6288_c0_g1_i2:256-2403(+)
MPALVEDGDTRADAFWRIVFALPLACPEVMYPGIIEILGEGYAHDVEDDSGGAWTAWQEVQDGLRLAQATYHAARTKWMECQDLAAAVDLYAKLRREEPGGVSSDALSDLVTLPSVQLDMKEVWIHLDVSRTWCFALEVLASNPLEGLTPLEALARWKEDLGTQVTDNVAQIFQQCDVPKHARLIPLLPERLPTNFIENCRVRLCKLRQRFGLEGSRRRFRVICQSYSWMNRVQVDRLLAELEGQEFALPLQPQPEYWSSGCALPAFSFQLVRLGGDTIKQFQAVFDKSWRAATTSDRKNPLADRFLVKDVVRVKNTRGWSEYVLRRHAITLERWTAGAVPEVEGVKLDRTLLPGQIVDEDGVSHAELFVETLAGAQELFLFHGTSLQGALNIAQNDFSTEFSSAYGLYGPGLYFAESVSKSDEYCDAEVSSGLCTILVCRVCMGNHIVVENPSGSMDEIIKDLDQSDKHSVLGDREKERGTYREFIVYDSSAVYAEYIVTYRRSFGADAQSARCASVAEISDSASALRTALAAARQRHSNSISKRVSSCSNGVSVEGININDSPWNYVGGEWAECLPVNFVDGDDPPKGVADQTQTRKTCVCPACSKEFDTEDALHRHLDAYAENDASGDHARVLSALNGREGAFNGRQGADQTRETCVCPACSKEFDTEDALSRHLAAYAENDASGDHARALSAFNGRKGSTSPGHGGCCTIL